MLKVEDFTNELITRGIKKYVGVPDSTFKDWISYIGDVESINHVIAVNECEATAIAAGQYLATGKPSLVYMQNDGLGKVINPYTSLCSKDVFSIPMLFMIGWRGEPGGKDASQHLMMGRIMEDMLKLLDIPYDILTGDLSQDILKIEEALGYMQRESAPYALVIRKGLFLTYNKQIAIDKNKKEYLSREEAIQLIVDNIDKDAAFVSTTGKASRELFELRKQQNANVRKDFYNIGAMGCAPSIAFGIASCKRNHQVYVVDGDGALLMQMGALATIGHYKLSNFKHILIDNNAHDSTGGQPNASSSVDFLELAKSCGYKFVEFAEDKDDIIVKLRMLNVQEGPALLVVRAACGARADLGRPDVPLDELKKTFMNNLLDDNE